MKALVLPLSLGTDCRSCLKVNVFYYFVGDSSIYNQKHSQNNYQHCSLQNLSKLWKFESQIHLHFFCPFKILFKIVRKWYLWFQKEYLETNQTIGKDTSNRLLKRTHRSVSFVFIKFYSVASELKLYEKSTKCKCRTLSENLQSIFIHKECEDQDFKFLISTKFLSSFLVTLNKPHKN